MAQLSVETIGGLRVEKRHPLIGAEVHGLDLSEALEPNTVKIINSLWLEHLLLIFPNRYWMHCNTSQTLSRAITAIRWAVRAKWTLTITR